MEQLQVERLVRSGRLKERFMLKPNPTFERTVNGGAARGFNQSERRRCLPLNANVGLQNMHHLLRALVLFVLIVATTMSNAGNFFPPEYKQFAFKEGDLLASRSENGHYAVNKILRVDKIVIRKGQSINIQGQKFVAPEDDYLLIVSAAYGEAEFESLEHARAAAKLGNWKIKLGHAPNRPPGAATGQVLIGSSPVSEAELVGYRRWRDAFDKGSAGVF